MPDDTGAGAANQSFDAQRLDALVEKIMPFASAADALARRIVGKVRALALLGAFAALWIAYGTAETFAFGLTGGLTLLVVVMLPSVVLWKLHAMLLSVVGLPQRIIEAATRVAGKAVELKQYYAGRDARARKVRFRELWSTARSVLEMRALGNEMQQIVAAAGGAFAVANPVFVIVLACATAATLVLISAATLVALSWFV
jgi:hypothetical protein